MCRIVVLLAFLIPPAGYATLIQTETHSYIVDKQKECLLVIDRKTQRETTVPIPEINDFHIHTFGERSHGYALTHSQRRITVLDLSNLTIIAKHTLPNGPYVLFFNKDYVYALEYWGTSVHIINLTTHSLISSLRVGERPQSITFYKDHGWILSQSGGITIINLSNFTLKQSFAGYPLVGNMEVFQSSGFVLDTKGTLSTYNLESLELKDTLQVDNPIKHITLYTSRLFTITPKDNTVYCMDLLHPRFHARLKIGEDPTQIVCTKNAGHVLHRGSKSLYLINLDQDVVSCKIYIGGPQQDMKIQQDRGYISFLNDSISIGLAVLDLTTNTVLKTVSLYGQNVYALNVYPHLATITTNNLDCIIDLKSIQKVKVTRRNGYDPELSCADQWIYKGSEKVCSALPYPVDATPWAAPSDPYWAELYKHFENDLVNCPEDSPLYIEVLSPEEITALLLEMSERDCLYYLTTLYRPIAFFRSKAFQQLEPSVILGLRQAIWHNDTLSSILPILHYKRASSLKESSPK